MQTPPVPVRTQAAAETQDTGLRSAVAALGRAAWEDARAGFCRMLETTETPEALEGLGLACWWLDDAASACGARERAYRLYRDRGEVRGAARMAIWLAWDHYALRGEPAVSNGWLRRAHRLLAGSEPTPEHGWLRVREGEIMLYEGDIDAARRLGAEAAELGRALAVLDIEMLGVSVEGLALGDRLSCGDSPRGRSPERLAARSARARPTHADSGPRETAPGERSAP